MPLEGADSEACVPPVQSVGPDLGVAGDKPDVDPRLAGLANNGGPTLTHALLFDSPAIDSVLPSVQIPSMTCPPMPATDQRAVTRPQDGDHSGVALCDIGAFELAALTASTTDEDNQTFWSCGNGTL